MDPERYAFQRWLANNRKVLVKYGPDEVAALAMTVGFDIGIVFEVLSHFRDALQGYNTQHKADQQLWQFEFTVDRHVGKPDLYPQWQALGSYLTDGTDFNEAAS